MAGGGVASAHRGGDDHHAAARLFTLKPDPAANPEGVASDGHAFYVSDTGAGAIYRGTLGNDTVTPLIPGVTGRSTVGLKLWRGKLIAAGGSTGKITVFDLHSKSVLTTFDTGAGGFLNDLVVTRHGDIYVTDSTRPTLWHVTRSGAVQALDVSASIPYAAGFNLNGIVAKRDHRQLVVVQSNTGKLFRIDLSRDGNAISRITPVSGVSVPGGDGMLLDHGRLIVVQGGPPAQLSFVKLRGTTGTVTATRTSPLLKGPSTIARDDDTYLIVNADFATSTKPFTVAGLPRDDDNDRRPRQRRRRQPDRRRHGDRPPAATAGGHGSKGAWPL